MHIRGTIAHSNSQFYEMNGGLALDSSILFEVAAADTLANGTTLTVSLWSASVFSDTVDETFDVIVSGGAVGTQSDIADSDPGVWQQHVFNFTVTDATQAINLKVLATRGSTYNEDLVIDLITVEGALLTGGPLTLSSPMIDEPSITETTADASVTLKNGPADVTLFWASTDWGTDLGDWQTNGSSSALGNQAAGTVNGSLSGLTNDTVYTVRFYAVNTVPDPDEEAWSAPVTFGTPFAAGQTVTDLAATAVTYNQIDLTWSDAFNTEEEYRIERSEDGINWSGIVTLSPGTTGFPDTGLNELTTYSYRILASSTQSGDSDWSNVAQDTTPARPSSIIFTEDFESPVGDPVEIPVGSTTFDNPVFADSKVGSPFAGRIKQTDPGTIAHSNSQFYEMNGGLALDSSILFEIAAADTLANGTTLTVSLWSASVFSDTVDETFDVIVSGGAVGIQSDTADSDPGVWQQHVFNFTVTDATQAINLKVLATRGSTTSEDLVIDLITVEAPPPAGTVIYVK